MEFLPKLASPENNHMTTSMTGRPPLQDIIKTAMEGAASKIDVPLEAARQITNNGGTAPQRTKTAAAKPDHIPTSLIHKLAAAAQYSATQLNPKTASTDFPTENSQGPGNGPNTLGVTAAQAEGDGVLEAGQSGKATAKNQPPMNPGQQKDPTRNADPGTGLATNDSMMHGEQPVEPISNETAALLTAEQAKQSEANALYINNLLAAGLLKTAATQQGIMLIPANDLVKEALVGGMLSGAATGAGKGAKGGAILGGGGGALGGGALGALGGAAIGSLTGVGAGKGALIGGGLGAVGGGLTGAAGGGLAGAGLGTAGGAALGAGRSLMGKTAADATKGESRGRSVGGAAGAIGGAVGASRLAGKAGAGKVGRLAAGVGGALVGSHVGSRLGGAAGRATDKQLDKIDPGGKKKKASVVKAAAAMVSLVKAAEGENALSPEEKRRMILQAGTGLGGLAGMAATAGHGPGGMLVGGGLGALGGAGLAAAGTGAVEGAQLGADDPMGNRVSGAIGGAARGLGGALPGGVAGGAAGALGGGLVGAGLGSAAGGALGAGLGALRGNTMGGLKAGLGAGALLGGAAGAAAGGTQGIAEGAEQGYNMAQGGARMDPAINKKLIAQAAEAEKAASVLLARNLASLGLYKAAEDAINPSQISAGKEPKEPELASASEEGTPNEPSDVNKQKALISSNQAAIDYTKRQAKADPKGDVGDVVTEPAQSASTDSVLNQALTHTNEAGAKIASADLTRLAGARAVLTKLAQAHNVPVGEGKKKKLSMMGGAGGVPNNPKAASGFNAAQQM